MRLDAARDDLRRGRRLRGDEVPIRLAPHAIERYAERVTPDLDPEAVARSLAAMLPSLTVLAEPPEWLKSREAHTIAYAMIGPGVCLPIMINHRGDEMIATTAMVEGSISE